jgi:hypothetical protein
MMAGKSFFQGRGLKSEAGQKIDTTKGGRPKKKN